MGSFFRILTGIWRCPSTHIVLCRTQTKEEMHSISIHKGEKPSSDFQIVERVCNIFRHRFSVPFSIQTPAVKGLRRASEATTTCLVPKYCKIGEMGILAHFPTGKPKTSDFFATKHGCLP